MDNLSVVFVLLSSRYLATPSDLCVFASPLDIYFVKSNTKRPLPFVSQISSIELSEFKDYQRL